MRLFAFALVVLATVSFQACYEASLDCSSVKTGQFTWQQSLNGELLTSNIIRYENYQIEEFQGKRDSILIRWVNDCEFILSDPTPTSNAESRAMLMRIISTDSLGYTFQYGYVGDAKKQTGTALFNK